MTENWPEVTLIILNWNGKLYLDDCLSSVFQLSYPHISVYMVDNGSSDDSVRFVTQNFPKVKIICNEQNLGFAKGNNVAVRQINTDIIVFLNPDTIVSREWLKNLVIPMCQNDDIGIAGCKIYYPGQTQLQHAGGYITYPQALPGHYGLQELDKQQYNTSRDVDYVIGAAMAVKRHVFDRIGLFDEGFFLYFEDVDLCYRARQAGYRVVYIPEATLIHLESVLTKKDSPSYLRHMHTGRWRYLLKHYSLQQLLTDTFLAEQNWLLHTASFQQKAAAFAYISALRTIQSIWSYREKRHGMNDATEFDKQQITEMLESLRETAVPSLVAKSRNAVDDATSVSLTLTQLQQKWQIQEKPFESQIPLIGTVIVKFRTIWNTLSTKWYVRHLIQQQNVINQLVVQYLSSDLDKLLIELDERVIDNDRNVTALTRQIADVSRILVQIERRLTAIETQLDNQTKHVL